MWVSVSVCVCVCICVCVREGVMARRKGLCECVREILREKGCQRENVFEYVRVCVRERRFEGV